jgi:hypothetical protein
MNGALTIDPHTPARETAALPGKEAQKSPALFGREAR